MQLGKNMIPREDEKMGIFSWGSTTTSKRELIRLANYFLNEAKEGSRRTEKELECLERALEGLPKAPKELVELMEPYVNQIKRGIAGKNFKNIAIGVNSIQQLPNYPE